MKKKIILVVLAISLPFVISGCRATYGGAGYDGTSDRSTYQSAQSGVIDLHKEIIKAEAERETKPILKIVACEGCTLTISGLQSLEVNAPASPLSLSGLPSLADVKPYVHPGWGVAQRAIDVVANPLVAFGFANEMLKNALGSQKIVTEKLIEPSEYTFRPVEDPIFRPVQ
jgi:predicted small secreted protein